MRHRPVHIKPEIAGLENICPNNWVAGISIRLWSHARLLNVSRSFGQFLEWDRRPGTKKPMDTKRKIGAMQFWGVLLPYTNAYDS